MAITISKSTDLKPAIFNYRRLFDIRRLSDGNLNAVQVAANQTGYYRIIFVTQGDCDYILDRKDRTVDTLNIGLVRPTVGFSLQKGRDADGYLLSFSHDFLQLSTGSSALLRSVFLNLREIDQLPLQKSEHRFLKDILERLIYESKSYDGSNCEIVQGLFQVVASFLNRATSQLSPATPGKCLLQTQHFFSLLDKYFTTLKMPADYARMMAVTPAYLNNMIKDTLGNTTSYFIQQRILVEAKRLISYNELNMKEVAYKLGFLDVSHFSKFFKRITGESFTDYKRAMAA
ncbi:helix-turn-helix domain-containing protein [Mucilaginibacter rubeus]|uniref:helix-turn-helix domain-containing protein n=1 Tax=Mucilaginibacter rubeus TaxID=2027860 RepID=UPI00166D2CCC|nr:helix-turn-helix domain-containing protein [Mucilaginibacter rubeus]GGA96108.1 AraC family transcriptional regulator [Mucilaginibacter rubeus]